MVDREEEIFNRLEQVMNDIDNLPQMNKKGVESLLEEWLD